MGMRLSLRAPRSWEIIGDTPKKRPQTPAKIGTQMLTATATPAKSTVPAWPLKMLLNTLVPICATCVNRRGKNKIRKCLNCENWGNCIGPP